MNKIINSDCLEGLKGLPDSFVDCCVTSPPYFGLRDYGHEGQIGMEETPEAFVQRLVDVFTEVRRVLKPEGTLWVNMGDSYASNGIRTGVLSNAKSTLQGGQGTQAAAAQVKGKIKHGVKEKDLIGVPWMLAFALRQPTFTCHGCSETNHSMRWGRFPNGMWICPVCELSKGHDVEDGWYLRQDIIWAKPNPMPESVTDRCTKSHEYFFLLSKSAKYFYDYEAIKEPCVWDVDGTMTDARVARADLNHKAMPTTLKNGIRPKKKTPQTFGGAKARNSEIQEDDPRYRNGSEQWGRVWDSDSTKRNKRSVWTVSTKPFSEAHFATFPEELIVDCIKAGCPIDGLVLDPFMGAGTTALVARKLNRNFIGFELNPEYIKIAEKRLLNELGMFQ